MHYRFGNNRDCPQIYDLICQLEQTRLPWDAFSRIWENQMASSAYLSLVCEEEGTILGVLNLRFEEQLHHARWIAEIMELAVRAELRSKGIGKKLFQWACEISREKGCLQLEVDCNLIRLDAHRFYQREGMKKCHYKFTREL